jgi:integrase
MDFGMKASRAKNDRYVWDRPGSRFFWFSMSVPKDYREHAGRARVQFSLNTTDRQEAVLLAGKWRADLIGEWRAKAGGSSPAPQASNDTVDLDVIAFKWGYQMLLEKLEKARQAQAGASDEMWQQFVEKNGASLRKRARQLATGDLSEIEATVLKIAARERLPVEDDETLAPALLQRLAIASKDAIAVESCRLAGDLDAEPKSALVKAQLAREAEKAGPGETLLELFDLYADQRSAEGRKRSDTLIQDRKIIEQFSAFVGRDRHPKSVTAADVRSYRDTLRQLPSKWTERRDFRGLSMREAAAKARGMEFESLSLATINKHLSTISPLYTWLIRERWDVVNPCTGLFFDKVKKRKRPPFTTERLNIILNSPLFTGFRGDGKEHLPGNSRADDWRYWTPLLCLFTGMRIGEAAQLRVGDVNEHAPGLWVIDIHHLPEKGQTTKAGESRATVAHGKLVEIGFPDFVERQRKRAAVDGDSRLFPGLVASERDQIGAVPSEFFRDYLTRIKVKKGRDGFGAHSFRHELADRLRNEVGLVDDQIAVALGHDQKSTTAGYGAVRQGTVKFLAPVIEQVRFDGVDFSHLS